MSIKQEQLKSIAGALGGLYTLFIGDNNVNLTGTVAETELFRQVVPAGLLGDSGGLIFIGLFTNNNSVNNKTINVKFGGQLVGQFVQTANLSLQIFKTIFNTNLTNQESSALGAAGFGANASALVATTVDTSIDQYLTFTGTLANAADNILMEQCYIGALPWSH